MVRGLYTAYTGMIYQQQNLDIISNNLANATTVGYKKEGLVARSFDNMYSIKVKDASEYYINRRIGKETLGVKIGEVYTDFSEGSYRVTDNPLDVAIDGNGFFNIEFSFKNGTDEVMYSRDGSFTTTKDGYLVTEDGDFVLGEGGRIIIPPETTDIKIEEDGAIYADGEYVDTLKITDFEDYNYLRKYGENLLSAVDGAVEKTAEYRVDQGCLEMSNMNVVSEMVDMITVSRAYESAQKVIQTIDSSLEKAVNLGKI